MARVQIGLYGKYHVSPNDRLSLSQLVAIGSPTSKIPDRTLGSKYVWSLHSSEYVWDKIKETIA